MIADREPIDFVALRVACCAAAHEVAPERASSLEGFCVEASIAVHAVAGGRLRFGVVDGLDHYWNELPDGSEIDLPSEQFGGDGFFPVTFGVAIAPPSPVPLRALLFLERVSSHLGSGTSDRGATLSWVPSEKEEEEGAT